MIDHRRARPHFRQGRESETHSCPRTPFGWTGVSLNSFRISMMFGENDRSSSFNQSIFMTRRLSAFNGSDGIISVGKWKISNVFSVSCEGSGKFLPCIRGPAVTPGYTLKMSGGISRMDKNSIAANETHEPARTCHDKIKVKSLKNIKTQSCHSIGMDWRIDRIERFRDRCRRTTTGEKKSAVWLCCARHLCCFCWGLLDWCTDCLRPASAAGLNAAGCRF
ncbi:hypothetical protein FBZ81_109124 [Azospirillum brasilense]|nr:hypothetical protein OH82_03310 [Azospirillum brasilense]TWB77090.1 hypothetical protein FBZ81_109124 [Azospirillum brasilense]